MIVIVSNKNVFCKNSSRNICYILKSNLSDVNFNNDS